MTLEWNLKRNINYKTVLKNIAIIIPKKKSVPAICFSSFFSQVQFPGTFDVEMPQSQATYQITKADKKAELKVQE